MCGGKRRAGNDWARKRIEHLLQRSAASQAASTAGTRDAKKALELQMHAMSVSAHPLEPRAEMAGSS